MARKDRWPSAGPLADARLLRGEVIEELSQPPFDRDRRRVAERLPGARDVGHGVADVAGARGLVLGGDLAADDLREGAEQRVQRGALAAADVEGEAARRLDG